MNKSICRIFLVGFLVQAGVAWGGAEDDAYYAAMEQMAAEADAAQVVAWSKHGMDEVDVGARLEELHKVSPSAWMTYKHLRPEYQEEVRKVLKSNEDIYVVIEMIFDRNH